jgi:hypothetical protein
MTAITIQPRVDTALDELVFEAMVIPRRRSRHDLLIRETCRGLLALTALDLGVHLVGTRVQQLDGLILELPHIAVQAKPGLRLGRVDPLTGN